MLPPLPIFFPPPPLGRWECAHLGKDVPRQSTVPERDGGMLAAIAAAQKALPESADDQQLVDPIDSSAENAPVSFADMAEQERLHLAQHLQLQQLQERCTQQGLSAREQQAQMSTTPPGASASASSWEPMPASRDTHCLTQASDAVPETAGDETHVASQVGMRRFMYVEGRPVEYAEVLIKGWPRGLLPTPDMLGLTKDRRLTILTWGNALRNYAPAESQFDFNARVLSGRGGGVLGDCHAGMRGPVCCWRL